MINLWFNINYIKVYVWFFISIKDNCKPKLSENDYYTYSICCWSINN